MRKRRKRAEPIFEDKRPKYNGVIFIADCEPVGLCSNTKEQFDRLEELVRLGEYFEDWLERTKKYCSCTNKDS